MKQQPSAPASTEIQLKTEILRVVLGKTLKRNGVPAQWIGGEINEMSLPTGEARIEVRLSVRVDEPRLLTYLASLQADFERRLLAIAPDAKIWVSGIVWTLNPDPTFEVPMPSAEYWQDVIADRELTARRNGARPWDREALERHFVDTDPGETALNFGDTQPPDHEPEDLPPLKR